MGNKKISQFNGYNLVDSELRTQIGEIDFSGKTLVAALEEKASAAELQTNKDEVNRKIAKCEADITAAATRISNIIGSAPEAFDTFKEVSEWITQHGEDFEALKNSVDNLLDINAMLQTYVTISALNERLNEYARKSEIPTATSELTNDSGFLTEHQDISGLATNERVQELSSQIPTKVSQLNNDAGFIDNSALSNYSPTTAIEATFAKKTEIPTLDGYAKTAEIESTYAKKSDITSLYKVKGSVPTTEDFTANPEIGDVYDVESNGMNYVWTGEKWDPLGSIIDMSPYALKSDVNDKISNIPAPGIAEVEYGEFKLDGIVTKPVNGVVRIPAVKGKVKHTLSGYLKGRIVVDNSNSIVKGNGNTTLILDNCYIDNAASGVNDDTSTAIYYEPDAEKLIIKLNPGTFNYIVNSGEKTGTFTENSGEIPTGAIHSNHDVKITGLGYLSIVTTAGGHGIKCKTFETEGKTHIYIEAYHDGIHCDKASEIKNAYIFVNKANDGIQCEEVLKAYLSEFHFANCVGMHMRGAVGSFYAGCTLEYSADKFENIMQISGSLYAGITKTCVKAVPDVNDVYYADNAPEATLGDVVVDDVAHTITSTYKKGDASEGVLIAGDWSEYELIVNMTDANSKIAAIILDGAILKKITLNSAKAKLNVKSNIIYSDKIEASTDPNKHNAINAAGLPNVIINGISANADVTINCDQDIVILNDSGDTAIEASEVSLKGDGLVFVKGSAKAAVGSRINFGADGIKDSNEGKKASGDFYIRGDLIARMSSSGKKGDIVVYSNHTGDTYAENMTSAANKITYTIATNAKGVISGGDVFALSSPGSFETLELYSEPFKYVSAYKTSAQLINNNVDELSKKINEKLLVKADKATTASGYGITDVYTKAEVDGKIPVLDGYATAAEISTTYATKAEVSAVSAKLPEVPTEDGTYTLKATVLNGIVTYSWVKEA